MELKFLGSGSAFCHYKQNFQTNMMLSNEGQNLLIDCGSDIKNSLIDSGFGWKDVHAVYISHLHGDHVHGLEALGFITYFSKMPKPKLYVHEAIAGALWNNVLSGTMGSIQGKIAQLDTYFDVHLVGPDLTFEWQHHKFQLVQTVHIMNGFGLVPSFGLMFDTPAQKKVFITTDTQHAPNQIIDFYRMSDVIFQDCETMPGGKSGVHAHFDDLKTLPVEIQEKMYLSHGQGVPEGYDPELSLFAGFVQRGEVFDFNGAW